MLLTQRVALILPPASSPPNRTSPLAGPHLKRSCCRGAPRTRTGTLSTAPSRPLREPTAGSNDSYKSHQQEEEEELLGSAKVFPPPAARAGEARKSGTAGFFFLLKLVCLRRTTLKESRKETKETKKTKAGGMMSEEHLLPSSSPSDLSSGADDGRGGESHTHFNTQHLFSLVTFCFFKKKRKVLIVPWW